MSDKFSLRWEVEAAHKLYLVNRAIIYFSAFILNAAKSFWSQFKMKVHDTCLQQLTHLRGWALLIPSRQTIVDHMLLWEIRERSAHRGLHNKGD